MRASRRSAVATGVCHAQTSRWFESPKGYYLLNIRVASDFGEQVASEQRQQTIRVLVSCRALFCFALPTLQAVCSEVPLQHVD